MAELADASDLGSDPARGGGSNPLRVIKGNTMLKIEPFTMSVFTSDGISVQAITPIAFTPEYDEDCEACVVHIDEIDLFAFGVDKNRLIQDIMDNIVYSWLDIALCDDSELDGKAIELKNKMKSMFIQLP